MRMHARLPSADLGRSNCSSLLVTVTHLLNNRINAAPRPWITGIILISGFGASQDSRKGTRRRSLGPKGSGAFSPAAFVPTPDDSSDNNYGDRDKKETISKRLVFGISRAKCAWQCFSPAGSDKTVLFFKMNTYSAEQNTRR